MWADFILVGAGCKAWSPASPPSPPPSLCLPCPPRMHNMVTLPLFVRRGLGYMLTTAAKGLSLVIGRCDSTLVWIQLLPAAVGLQA